MSTERTNIDATQGQKVTGKFDELADAQAAIERLKAAGFSEEVITLTTRGGHTDADGTFVRGGVEVSVLADEKADEAERILAEKR